MAKNSKGGLGRGLNSLIGGYEAALEPAATPAKPASPSAPVVSPAPTPAQSVPDAPAASSASVPASRTAAREVIREEDLAQEERVVLNVEKKEYGIDKPSYPSSGIKVETAVRDVVAKKELIEENDGVIIKGVVERVAKPQSSSPASSATSTAAPSVISGSSAAPSSSLQTGVPARPAATLSKQKSAEGSDDGDDGHRMTDEVPIELVKPNPDQPRMHFNKEELDELSSSIEKDGLLQPILVREVADGYEIIAGERRWQACKLAGMRKVPVRIKEADDMKVLELALIENLQRSDLNPIEEAYGYKRMMERSGRTQSEVAAAVSKGRSTIANALRLLDLPERAQQLLYEEKITAGHARAILSVPTEEGREKLTDKLVKEKLSVREAESLARLFTGRIKAAGQPPKPPMPKFYRSTARSLTAQLGTKVRIRSANGKNKIEIEFADEEDLHRLLEKMHESDTQA